MILGILSFSYCLNLFQRYSPAVLFDHLTSEIFLTETEIGLIGSIFFYCYSITLIFAGYIVDRMGARMSLFLGLMIMALGSYIFTVNSVISFLMLGRAFVGIGSAMITIPVYKAAREVFPHDKYGSAVGIINTGGYVGTIAASVPLAFLLSIISWKEFYLGLSIFIAIMAVIAFFYIGSYQKKKDVVPEDRIKFSDLLHLLTNSRLWILCIWMLMFTGTKLAFQGLWAGLYFSNLYGQERGPILLMLISFGSILGAPFLGKISDKSRSRRNVLSSLTLVVLLNWLFLYIFPQKLNLIIVIPFYFFLGIGFTAFSLALMEVRDICPVKMTGSAVGIICAVGFLGSALFIQIVGGFFRGFTEHMDIIPYIRPVFLLNSVIMLAVLIILIIYEIWIKRHTTMELK